MANAIDHTKDCIESYNQANVIVNNYLSGNAFLHQGDIIHTPPQDMKQAFRKALQYDSMFEKVDQLSIPCIPIRSFDWIWNTPFKDWLRNVSSTSDSCFWISGKPGSGKSTLMHYLINDQDTKKIISKQTERYIILNFFFDYRAGGNMANHQMGLIKCFLSQLCDQAPEVEMMLARRYLRTSSPAMNQQRGLQMLRDGLASLGTATYTFIDGLDEYQGNHAQLADLILHLQHQSGMRICFASRPESLLIKKLDRFPILHMHQHNGPSIDRYIQDELHIAQDLVPNIELSIDTVMKEAITEKADGVMIWARLVVDHLIWEAKRGASREDLTKLLDSLPEELERMYDQIFLRIAFQEMPQAALILWFLAECGGACLLEHLYGFWHFLYMDSSGHLPTQHIVNIAHFSSHVNRLCGSFIEIRNVSERRSWQDLFRKRTPTELESQIGRTPLRLMHKTLQPYVSSSELIHTALPQDLTRRYSKSFEAVCADMVTKTSVSPDIDLATFESDAWAGRLWKLTRSIDNAEKRDKSSPRTARHYQLILGDYWKPHIPGWQRSFLALSMSTIDACLSRRKFYCPAPESYQIIKSALCSAITYSLKFMAMEDGEAGQRWIFSSIKQTTPDDLTYQTLFWACLSDAQENHCLDLIMAMVFGLSEYVDSALSMSAVPSTTTCTWLVSHIMAMMAQRGRVTADYWDTVGRVLQLTWPRVSGVNLDLLFVVSQSIASSGWYQKSDISRFALFSKIVLSLQHTSNQHRLFWTVTPHSPVFSFTRVDDCIRQPSHALHQWLQLMVECNRVLELASKNSLLSDVLEALLKVSLSVAGAGAGTVCEKCGGVLQYLITLLARRQSWIYQTARRKSRVISGGISLSRTSDGMRIGYSWLQMTIFLARLGATPGTNESLQLILKQLDQILVDLNQVPSTSRSHVFILPIREIFDCYQQVQSILQSLGGSVADQCEQQFFKLL